MPSSSDSSPSSPPEGFDLAFSGSCSSLSPSALPAAKAAVAARWEPVADVASDGAGLPLTGDVSPVPSSLPPARAESRELSRSFGSPAPEPPPSEAALSACSLMFSSKSLIWDQQRIRIKFAVLHRSRASLLTSALSKSPRREKTIWIRSSERGVPPYLSLPQSI